MIGSNLLPSKSVGRTRLIQHQTLVARFLAGDESSQQQIFDELRFKYLPGALSGYANKNPLFNETECESAYWLGVAKGMKPKRLDADGKPIESDTQVIANKGDPISYLHSRGMYEIFRQYRKIVKRGLISVCPNGHVGLVKAVHACGVCGAKMSFPQKVQFRHLCNRSHVGTCKNGHEGVANQTLVCQQCGLDAKQEEVLDFSLSRPDQDPDHRFVYVSEQETGFLSIELFSNYLNKKAKLSTRQKEIVVAIRQCIKDGLDCTNIDIQNILNSMGIRSSKTSIAIHKSHIRRKSKVNAVNTSELVCA